MDAVEYSRLLKALLPPGPAWPHETDEASAFDGLIKALSQEPARIEADALLALETLIPDSTNTDLAAWERLVGSPDTNLTDAARLARIRGMLRSNGEISRDELEPAFQAMAGDTNVKLFNRFRPSFAAGASNAGDSCGSHPHEWLCELYPNVLAVDPDDFEAWSGFAIIANDDTQSPVTLSNTAATAKFLGNASTPLAAEDGDTVYFSMWVRPISDRAFTVRFLGRNNVQTTAAVFDLPIGRWHRVTYEAAIGSGATTPQVRITGTAAVDYELSWAVAGVRDYALEARCKALTQIHTRGWFGVQGEYETLMSQAPMEVCW